MKYPKKLQTIHSWLKRLRLPVKITFFLMGILSTAWFLIRVIPKPSRATYPCMRAAAPVMSGFIVYLLSLLGSATAIRIFRKRMVSARYFSAIVFLAISISAAFIFIASNRLKARADANIPLGIHEPNAPIGTGVGIFPGRVVWAWDPDATNENCSPTTYGDGWFLEKNNDQDVIDRMFHDAILKLTGEKKVEDAWDALFRFHNLRKKQTDATYTPGEKIFIKINITSAWGAGETWGNMNANFEKALNNYYGTSETSPQVVLSVLRELVDSCGVNQADIYLGDPMKNIYKHQYDMWNAEYPDVNYLGNDIHYANIYESTLIENGRTPVVIGAEPDIAYSDQTVITNYLDRFYTIVEEADYMINIPALKAHARAGITLTAKNHFGSQTRSGADHLHPGLVAPNEGTPTRTQMHMYRVQVDLMGHPMLGLNTMLFIVDGLWAGSEAVNPPTKWDMAPFNGDWTSSLFLSQDQVAIESVCFDFLRTEYNGTGGKVNYPNYAGVDDYLEQAADPANWPEGFEYMPDGEHVLTSLGTNEHWNNSTSKQYSRNLGLNEGIQLLSIPEGLVLSSADHEVISGTSGGINNAYPNPFSEYTTIEYQVTILSTVEIDVINVYGQVVKILLKEIRMPGTYSVIWDGNNENSVILPAGMYFIRMKSYTNTGLQTNTRQVLLLR
jgi:hypothetical protein